MGLLTRLTSQLSRQTVRFRHSGTKVTVLGASGAIGQPLALLLKQHPRITHLALYDLVPTTGIAKDLSHINTHAQVSSHSKPEELQFALEGSELVMIVAGAPRRGAVQKTDDLFSANAPTVRALSEAIARHCPEALIGVVTQPINMLMPLVSAALGRRNAHDGRRVFGVTTLNTIRARTVAADCTGMDAGQLCVPVYGGSTDVTVVPVFSQMTADQKPSSLSPDDQRRLVDSVQSADDYVFEAKTGKGSAALSMAYAASLFVDGVLQALDGKSDVVRSLMVRSNLVPGVDYFASKVQLGKQGVERLLPLGELNDQERRLMDAAVPKLKQDIARGINYVNTLEYEY